MSTTIHDGLATLTVTFDPMAGTVKLAVVVVNEEIPSAPATPGTFTISNGFGEQFINLPLPAPTIRRPPVGLAVGGVVELPVQG
jgi:hypothetical protein